MKSLLLVAAAILLAPSAAATPVKFGPHAGIYVPMGDYGEMYSLSPEFGGHALISLGAVWIEASVSYVPLSKNDDYVGYELFDDYRASIIPVLLGVRKSFGVVDFGAGGVLNSFSESAEYGTGGSIDNTDSGGGFYGVLAAGLPAGTVEVEVALRLETVNFAFLGTEPALSFTVGANF
ncbi:hypothetical protein GF402_08385 [Candidatus Fermentibacteria bacterium]|nr:hypothetical protein [Candidatus Fermentibacteria bacterium]